MSEKAFYVREDYDALRQITLRIDELLKKVGIDRQFRRPDQGRIMPLADRLILRVVRFILGRLEAHTNVVYMKAVREDNVAIADGQWQR